MARENYSEKWIQASNGSWIGLGALEGSSRLSSLSAG